MNKNDKNGRGKKLAASVVGVLGLGSVMLIASGTVANWTDSEAAVTEARAGQLDLQISTDDRQTWQDGTAADENSYAELAMSGFDPEVGYIDSDFSLRLSPDSTHDAVVSAESIESVFNVNPEIAGEYGFYIHEANLLVEGVVGSNSPISANGEVQLEAGDLEGRDFTLVVYPLSYVSDALVGDTDSVVWNITAELGETENEQVFAEPEFELPELGEHTRFVEE